MKENILLNSVKIMLEIMINNYEKQVIHIDR